MFGAESTRLFYPLLVFWILGVGGASAQTVGNVRLTGGNSPSEGRVEVFWFGMWGTVCDDHWGLRHAMVVCRELGYSSVASEHTKFDAGSGLILLDDIHCSGGEMQLQDCPHADWGLNDCTHEEDVGVVCSNATAVNETVALPEEEKTYRLYGGASPSEGVLQFRSSANETWNTVCSSSSPIDPGLGAEPCKLLGYKVSCSCEHVARVQGFSTPPGFGDFPLKRTNISCRGTSEGIIDCNLVTDVKNTQICSLDEAIWIVCGSDLDVRLTSVVHENEGVLQARCRNTERWYDVCGNDNWTFSEESARVACRHLGFSGSLHVLPYLVTPGISPSILDWISCSGKEENLTACEFWQPFGYHCEKHVGLRCIGREEILELGLVDSQYEASGLVVGRFGTNDEWGAICQGSHWDSRDAQVTCRHLGFYSSINVGRGDIVYDASALPTFAAISDVGCLGNETDLTQCELVSGGGASCSAFAYVECIADTKSFEIPAFLCGEIHYCGFDCNQGPRNTHRPIKEETCKCDDACAFFNDCCYDYQSSCKPNHDIGDVRINGVDIEHYSCVLIPNEGGQLQVGYGFALVSLCPKQWPDPFVRRHCEEVADKNDIIGSLPVHDSRGAVYKNIFCAICQGADLGDLHKWNVSLEYEKSENVTYDARFNLTINGTLTGRYVFEPPAGILGTARTCPVETIGSCHDEFLNTSLQEACKDYFAPLTVNEIGFHNPHCAMCNGLTVEPTATCGPLCTSFCSTEDKWALCENVCLGPDVPQGPLSIEALFDFGWGTDKNSMCQPGQLFDPFLSRCRTVFCLSGITNEDGGCISDSSQLPQQTSRWFSLLDANCTALVNASLGMNVIFWQAIPTIETGLMDGTRGDYFISIIVQQLKFISRSVSDFVATLGNHTIHTSLCNISALVVYVLEGAPLLSGIYDCANATLKARDILHASAYNISTLEFSVHPRYTWVKDNATPTRNLAMPQECLDVLELKCEEVVLLNADEYDSGGASQYIRHIPTGLEFEPTEYVFLPSGKAAVCRPARWIDPHADALGYISLVCSSLSLLALVATFVTYCAFSSLRNLAGMYTMNLMVALFVAFLTFVLVGSLRLEGRSCLATAAMLHLSWLSAFFWMAILSCNAAVTFGRRSVIPSGSKPSYRSLLAAMVCSWGGALLVVSSCLVISLFDCTDLPSIYSESPPCLITGGDVRLVVFGAPLAASLLVSSLCFIFVVYKVRKAKRDSKMVQRKGQMKEALDEVKIYAKLALLFGVTWILLFVSGAVDHIIPSYISTVINTMQGVFMFVAFCLNRNVRGLWRDRMGKQREDSKKLATSDRKQMPKQSLAAVVSSESAGTEDTRL